MSFVTSPTELSTSVTDAMLAIECVLIIAWLARTATANSWRAKLWCWVFGLLAFTAALGALAHGIELSAAVRTALWKPLYLSLGVLVALFVIGAVYDWQGQAVAKRLVPWGIAMGAVFFVITELLRGAFIIFVLYEALALLSALTIYTFLAAKRRTKGAAIIALAIVLNLAAAGVQASHVSLRVFSYPLDHNGVFHLVQVLGTATLALGVRRGMNRSANNAASTQLKHQADIA